MRKLLPALLCGVLLPGCVLAIGNGDDGKKSMNRIESLEHRVSMLEQQLHHGDGPMHGDFLHDQDDHGPDTHH